MLWPRQHYWSNFEIADMDFFRSREYRELFDFLDGKGGFYFERASEINSWGDASIHSLAAALFLPPHQLHHFQDFGYFHEPWRVCPANARGARISGPTGPCGLRGAIFIECPPVSIRRLTSLVSNRNGRRNGILEEQGYKKSEIYVSKIIPWSRSMWTTSAGTQ
ncbi:glycosyltransferase family 15 protein [Zopfia rhizophila CBS 207.26]|uniref:Glycosyltransferase family 15 protein n=1 Tax=Zopfia rhizophila CBS 207.26 TaxID=1314779 RepID=A0A6A6EFG3_9PEZI|nr:glycosyltransferase family 15 protein [Zopfia rhizophila CBS 207.26]